MAIVPTFTRRPSSAVSAVRLVRPCAIPAGRLEAAAPRRLAATRLEVATLCLRSITLLLALLGPLDTAAVVTSGSPAPPSPRLRDDAAVGAVDHLPPEVRRARAEPDHHLVGGLEQLAGQHGGQPELGGGEAVPQQHHEGRGDLAVAAVRGGEGGVLVRQTEERLLLVSANQRLPKMQTC